MVLCGLKVVLSPLGSVMTTGVVFPVGTVTTPALFEMIVSLSELTVVTTTAPVDPMEVPVPIDFGGEGVNVVFLPSDCLMTVGDVNPVFKVNSPSLFEMVVWPLVAVVVTADFAGL